MGERWMGEWNELGCVVIEPKEEMWTVCGQIAGRQDEWLDRLAGWWFGKWMDK